jgi:Fur family peroxide stress response transcriptional regulator
MLSTLKSHDFRITPQRLFVFKILAESEGHPTVEEIYEQVRAEFPTTSLATVYKTIALLKEVNEVLELRFPDRSNRYDGNKPFPPARDLYEMQKDHRSRPHQPRWPER